jgi:hypothetical protein
VTFTQLQYNVYRRMGFADSPDSAVVTRVKQHLNEVYRRILGLPGMEAVRPAQATLTTVANVARYGVAYQMARITAIRDTTNDYTLRSEPFAWYTIIAPDPSATTGNPEVWVPLGFYPVYRQPSSEDSLQIVSSAAGDTTQTCYLEGTHNSVYTSTSFTLNGTTAVTNGTKWSELTKIYVSAACAGIVSVWQTAVTTGTLLAQIPIGKTHARYQGLALWPTPSSAVSLTVDGYRAIPDLVNGTDEPQLPEDFHALISDGARMLEYERQDDTRYAVAKADFEKGLRDLKWYLHGLPDARPSGAGGPASRLGPWFPKGS